MTYNSQRREVILHRLIWSTQFKNFLATKWTAAKRFGLESGETLIPGMKEMFDRSADLAVESIVIGMLHRVRLNVLGNVVRKPLRQIFSEFSGGIRPIEEVGLYTGTGDVKYHLGTSLVATRGGKRIHLSLVANPSHLEAVDPVVVGKTRAKQYYSNDVDRTKNLSILIHGDGSFAGQGVVYETLHLSALPNYTTGGTIHIVVNNQVAFTTDPKSGRSSQYCTDVAKALNAPMFHVNGDDVETVVHACELPKMYKVIRNHPSALKIYQKKLLETGQATKEDIDRIQNKVTPILNDEFLVSKDYVTSKREWIFMLSKLPDQLPLLLKVRYLL
ncbi:2-oxoglutarate dehydrogenase, mitochondrial-like protein [Tanacetum coccineum]